MSQKLDIPKAECPIKLDVRKAGCPIAECPKAECPRAECLSVNDTPSSGGVCSCHAHLHIVDTQLAKRTGTHAHCKRRVFVEGRGGWRSASSLAQLTARPWGVSIHPFTSVGLGL